MKNEKRIELLEDTNLKQAMETINEKYKDYYEVVSKKRKIRFKAPFSIAKDYEFELELNHEQKAIQQMIEELRESKNRRLQKKEMILSIANYAKTSEEMEQVVTIKNKGKEVEPVKGEVITVEERDPNKVVKLIETTEDRGKNKSKDNFQN